MILLLILGLTGVAHADEQAVEYVPAGSSVTATAPAYLLPERMFDKCLTDSAQLRDSVGPGLEMCTDRFSAYRVDSERVISDYQDLLRQAEESVTDLSGNLNHSQTQLTIMRNQRNTLLGVVAAVVIGGTVAAVVVK